MALRFRMTSRVPDNRLDGWPHFVVLSALAGVAGTIFVIDLTTLHGVTVWVLYLPLCVLVAWLDRPREAIAASVIATLLIAAGALLSPTASPNLVSLVNRSLEALTIWLAVAVVVTRRHSIQVTESAANAVRNANTRLSGILDNADDAIIAIDRQQRITLFNHGAERAFGYGAAEVIGQSLSTLLPPSTTQEHRQFVNDFGASNVQARRMADRRAVAGRRKDGSEFLAEVSISKSSLDDGVTYTAILRDIGDRIKAEALFREHEQRLRLALSAGHMGVFQVDETTGIARLDQASLNLLEFDPARPEFPAEIFFESIDPADRDKVRSTVEQARQRGGEYSLEFRMPLSRGRTRWIAVRGFCELDAQGAALRTTGIAYDVTERKHIQEELEARVAERTAALRNEVARREETQAALARAQKLQAVGELAGGMAHNFNNLLTVIIGNLELMGMRQLPDQTRDLLRRAEESAKMGARLTRRLLAIGRKQRLQPQVLNLNEIATGMTDVLARTLGQAIEIRTSFAEDLWPTLADISEVENAILNLAINARDAMPNGGTLIISTNNQSLRPDDLGNEPGFEPGDYAVLSISDTGAGIPPEHLARIFEPFYTTKETGTGLGLSTIYGFAKQSGGHLSIHSEPGNGTSVKLYLPRAAAGASTADATPQSPAQDAADGETILVVEDDPDVRNTSVQRLDTLGYRVLSADGGTAALAMLQSAEKIDLVLSDVVMPRGMSGLDLARWVRTNRPDVRMILTSGFAHKVGEADQSDLSGIEFLSKPYAIADLARAVRHALASS